MKNFFGVLFVFFVFAPALSWGACVEVTWAFTANDKGCGDAACIAQGLNDYWLGQACGGGGNFCTLIGYGVNPNGSCYNWNSRQDCLATLLRCSTQDEADSAKCALNPEAEGCTDACTEYKNACEAKGGKFEGVVNHDMCTSYCDLCNSPNVLKAKKELYESCCKASMTPEFRCAFTGLASQGEMAVAYPITYTCNTSNWETNKTCKEALDSLNSSSSFNSSSSSVPVSSSSSVSEYCQIFPDDLACICADDSTRPECAYLRSSSSEGAPEGSSGSGEGGEGSSGSGGGEGGEGSSGSGGGGAGGVGDWEYDYRDSLHKIINSTTRTAKNTQGLKDSLGTIATILRYAKCLWQDCTNYDSLRAVFGSESGDSSDIQGIDLDTSGYLGGMEALRDSLAEYWGWGDSATLGDVGYGIDSGSVDSAYGAIREHIGSVFGEGGNNPAQSLGDSLKEILEDKFPTSSWGYTQTCPEVLRTPVTFNIAGIEVNSGVGLGRYFCSPLPTLGLTLGTIARAVIRLIITITMAFGIYKFAMTGGKGE